MPYLLCPTWLWDIITIGNIWVECNKYIEGCIDNIVVGRYIGWNNGEKRIILCLALDVLSDNVVISDQQIVSLRIPDLYIYVVSNIIC